MLWRLLQVYWLISVLDLRCTAFDDKKPFNLKTKNNGKIDPFSFEVFPTSRDSNFGKFRDNEENDPDMSLFFKDVDFFDEDDSFYKTPFGGDNMTIKDFFSKTLEDSRNKYMEDVSNIDKMFKKPVKSSIDGLLKDETTHREASSKNPNISERNGIFNTNTERNGHPTTKRSIDTQRTNSLNTKTPKTNSVNSKNPPRTNNSLFSDVSKAVDINKATKLVLTTEKDAKDVVNNGEKKDGNRESRGAVTNEELLGSQELNQENSFLESTNVVTEISVQETVNGKTVERKPSSEELRLIESKLLGLSLQNTKDQVLQRSSQEPKSDDKVGHNQPEVNVSKNVDDNSATEQKNLPNDVIDDLSSFLKVDPNFADDGMDKMLVNDEEIMDMDAILRDKDEEYNNLNQENERKTEEISKNIINQKNDDENQDNERNRDVGREEDPKSKLSLKKKNGEDPRDYRKIFHTEHKNLSNVSDVKITFSETEGDFLDDDDDNDDSEYSASEKPEVAYKKEIAYDNNDSNEKGKELIAKEEHTDTLEDLNAEVVITEASNLQKYTNLPERINRNFKTNDKDTNLDEITTMLNNIKTKIPQTSKSTKNRNNNKERSQYIHTDFIEQTTDNIYVTEKIPNTKETKSKDFNKFDNAALESEEDILSNNNFEKKTAISSQNINGSAHSEESTTELYDEFDDLITEIPDISFGPMDTPQEMDDIDRTMALIKQILAAEAKNVDEKSQNQTNVTKIVENDNTENVKDSSDIPSVQETVTIPLDTSTIPINLDTYTEEFTYTTNYMGTTTERIIQDDSSGNQMPTVGDGNNIAVTTTAEVVTNTKISVEGNYEVNDTIDRSTEPNIVTTTLTNILTETTTTAIEAVNTDAPKSFNFKEVAAGHELSPSEVEAIYNSKIEEYESLEDNSNYFNEDGGDWTIFGNNNKKQKSKNGKEFGNNNGEEIVTASSKNLTEIDNIRHKEDVDKFKDEKEPLMPLVPVLRGVILNNTAEFSVKISTQEETFYVPSSAHVQEHKNIVNITWKTNEYLNNSIALVILEKEYFYVIKEIMINLLTGNKFTKQKKAVALNPDPDLDDSVSGKNRIVMMKDGTYIFFSNVDFLRKSYEPLEYSEASMRERRLWHIEIASICLAAVAVIAVVLYVVALKTRRKITLREKNELAQVTHC